MKQNNHRHSNNVRPQQRVSGRRVKGGGGELGGSDVGVPSASRCRSLSQRQWRGGFSRDLEGGDYPVFLCFAGDKVFPSDCFSRAGMSLETNGIAAACDARGCSPKLFPCPRERPGPGSPGMGWERTRTAWPGQNANAAAGQRNLTISVVPEFCFQMRPLGPDFSCQISPIFI